MSVDETVQKLGWVLENNFWGSGTKYRAVCPGISGGFPTPWRDSEEAALNDVLLVKAGQNREAVGPQKGRW